MLYHSAVTAEIPNHLLDRVHQNAREWRLKIEESFETETSVISFVTREGQSLVLKTVKHPDDEWNAGAVVSAFEGRGIVRVYEYTGGAMLLERLWPGTNLVELAMSGHDEEATDILADVIRKMSSADSGAIVKGCPTVEDWGDGFARYLVTGDDRIPHELVESAQELFAHLCASQSRKRLLHGDLQHYNVLFDSARGWVAIDPKGVTGELEYEVGALLRNPIERPDLFLATSTIERRLRQFEARLSLNYERMLAWAFAQAVLSAIWSVEDGFEVDPQNPALRLANLIRPMMDK
jgi:streptomycin 6-kinase